MITDHLEIISLNKKLKKLKKKNKRLEIENKKLKEQLILSGVGKSKIKENNYTKLISTLKRYRKENVIVDSFEERRGFVDVPCDFGYSEIIPNGETTITINLVKE